MWNTEKNGRQQVEGGRVQSFPSVVQRRTRRIFHCLLLSAFCLLLFGCRQDMQDQPRYEVYEPSTFYANGQSSRPMVEGTVPRGHLKDDTYFYTGKTAGGATAAGGNQSGGSTSQPTAPGTQNIDPVLRTGSANLQGSGGANQPGGDVNRRGNVAGGIPGGSGNAQDGNTSAGGGTTQAGGGAAALGGADRFPFPITAADLARGQERYNIYCSVCHGASGDGDGMIVRRGFRKPPAFTEDRLQEGQAAAAHFFDVITNGWGAMPDYSTMIPAEDRWRIIAYVRALQLSRRANVADVPADQRGKTGTTGGQPQQAPAAAEQHGGQQR